jgi:hypothetical protein
VAESKPWVVTTSGDRPINEIAGEVVAAGFVIDEVFESLGIITGSATDSVAETVRAIPGVTVEPPAPPAEAFASAG